MSSSSPTGWGPSACTQRRRFVVHVDQHPTRDCAGTARALRDVGRGIVVAEQRFEARVARLGDDLAVAVGIELVDHHAVVADQVAHRAGGGVREHAQVRRLSRCAARPPHPPGATASRARGRRSPRRRPGGSISGISGPSAIRCSAPSQRAAATSRSGLQRDRFVGAAMWSDAACTACASSGAAAVRRPSGQAAPFGVDRGSSTISAGLVQHQQQAVRLDRPGQVDELAAPQLERSAWPKEGRRLTGSPSSAAPAVDRIGGSALVRPWCRRRSRGLGADAEQVGSPAGGRCYHARQRGVDQMALGQVGGFLQQLRGSAATPSWAARRSNASASSPPWAGAARRWSMRRSVSRCIPGRPRPEGPPRSRPRSQAPAASDHRPPLLGDAQVPPLRGTAPRAAVAGIADVGQGPGRSPRGRFPALPRRLGTARRTPGWTSSRRPCGSVITTASGVRSMKSANRRFPASRDPSAGGARTSRACCRRLRNGVAGRARTLVRRYFRRAAPRARSSPGRRWRAP